MAGYTQGRVARGWWAGFLGVEHGAPLPCFGRLAIAVGEAGAADTGQLVDAREVVAADQQTEFGATVLERFGGVVHGGGAGADDDHSLAAQRREVDVIGSVCPEVAGNRADEVGGGRVAQALDA